MLLALEDQPGADEPTPAELADDAAALGLVAADAADRDPLPGRVTVLRELRAAAAPEGTLPPADTRLVGLAGFPLAYDHERRRFLPRAREAVPRHTEQTVSGLAGAQTLIDEGHSAVTRDG